MAFEEKNPGKTSTSLLSQLDQLTLEDYKFLFDLLAKELICSATDAQGTIIYVNDKFCEVSGYSREELIGKNHRIFKSDCHSQEFYDNLWNTISCGHVWHGEIKNRAKDGSFFWIETSIAPILGADRKPDKYISIQTLITEKKTIEFELQKKLLYTQSLVDAILDPFITMGLDEKITDLNEEMVKISGFTREELINSDFYCYFVEQDDARAFFKKAFDKGSILSYPLTLRSKTGELIDVLYNASLYKDAQGKTLGVFAAARDVTTQKKIKEELARQSYLEQERILELEKFQKLIVGRELRMIELKREIQELKKENETLKKKVSS